MRIFIRALIICCLAITTDKLFAQPVNEFAQDANTILLLNLNEGSGVVAADASLNGLDGLLRGTPQWVPGRFGSGLKFNGAPTTCAISYDGASSFVQVPHSSSLNVGTGDYTVESWVYLDVQNTTYDNPIVLKGRSSAIAYWALQVRTDLIPGFCAAFNNDEVCVNGPSPFELNQWYHIAGVRNGTQYILYINGVEVNRRTKSLGSPDTNEPIYFGHVPYHSPLRFLAGDQDEIRLWNYARTAAEISAARNQTISGTETGLIGLWNFDECTGESVLDHSSNQNHGTLVGTYEYAPASWAGSAEGDAIDLGSPALLEPDIFTLECWINADSLRPNQMLIITSAKDYHGYALSLVGGRPSFEVQSGGQRYQAIAPDQIVPGTWYHLAGTFDGMTVRTFVDGCCAAAVAGSLSDATYPLFVGTDVTPPYVSDPFRGTVDDVRLSDVLRYTCDSTGTISFTVSPGYSGVMVDLFDESNALVAAALTAAGGGVFSALNPGTYYVELIEPLGMQANQNHVQVVLAPRAAETVNFVLNNSITVNDARSKGYWKHQVKANLTGHGHADYDEGELESLLASIYDCFYLSPVNHIQIIGVTHSGAPAAALSLMDMSAMLSVNQGGSTPIERASSHTLALLLNVASGKLAQYAAASTDGATVSQAVVHIAGIINSNPNQAKLIAETLNNAALVCAGVIPLSTPDVLFSDASSFGGAMPNPFNPTTTLQFTLAAAMDVSLIIYDILGREVATLADGRYLPGTHSVNFDGSNLASGIYFAQFRSANTVKVQKLMLLK
ncbi:MAG: T9SS type A sorting domain-containing protein [bacterium]|nr:T9SS type A sorting domain-containing protein [bacterium]